MLTFLTALANSPLLSSKNLSIQSQRMDLLAVAPEFGLHVVDDHVHREQVLHVWVFLKSVETGPGHAGTQLLYSFLSNLASRDKLWIAQHVLGEQIAAGDLDVEI